MSKQNVLPNRNDWTQTFLSDTSPIEVPVLISNDDFYANFLAAHRPEALSTIIGSIMGPLQGKDIQSHIITKLRKTEMRFDVSVCLAPGHSFKSPTSIKDIIA